MIRFWPVIMAASSDARNNAAPAMSVGWLRRPSGTPDRIPALNSSRDWPGGRNWPSIGVSVDTGETLFTRMDGANSWANTLVSCTTPAFATAYAEKPVRAFTADRDAVLTIDPPPLADMGPTAYLQHQNTLVRFTRSCRSHSSGLRSTKVVRRIGIPALLNATLREP